MPDNRETIEKIVLTQVMRLNASIHGVVSGLVAGLGLFVATNWLVLKGGPIGPEGDAIIGPNLALLSQFFIGYNVTFLGSIIGFVYAFVVGFAVGFFIAKVYNWIVDWREHRLGRA
jgi:hypothetical protein